LYINRNIFLFSSITIILLFLALIFTKNISVKNINVNNSNSSLSNADISEPRFAINNENKKIFITANEGNFLNSDEILLKNNVRFKSNDFSIETENVIFNRTDQTAQSKTRSLFKSENTLISSDGFDIQDKGNIIIFYGKSYLILR
tara:strand:+ start:756 stop:1193 length:438 start_codon:yes stop_codon:yes gene_type:complete